MWPGPPGRGDGRCPWVPRGPATCGAPLSAPAGPCPAVSEPASGLANASAPPRPAMNRPEVTRHADAATRTRERMKSPPFGAPASALQTSPDCRTNAGCRFASCDDSPTAPHTESAEQIDRTILWFSSSSAVLTYTPRDDREAAGMGLFTRRKSRATRRAEARAIKAKAKLEARLAAKNEARRIKADRKAEQKALKAQLRAQRETDRNALKIAETQLRAAREGKLLSPTRVRRLLTVTRLLAPVLVPVVYRAAIAARGAIDERRADQLGVPRASSASSPDTARSCRRASPGPSRHCGWSPRRSRKTPRPSSSSRPSTTGSPTSRPPSRPPRTCRRRAGAAPTRPSPRSSTASTPT